MYGFGDEVDVREDTAELMEDYLVDYISTLTVRAMSFTAKPKAADFLRVLRHDRNKVSRAQQLLRMDKELKSARALLSEPMAEDTPK